MLKIIRHCCVLTAAVILQSLSVPAARADNYLFNCMDSWSKLNYTFEQRIYDSDSDITERYQGILQVHKPNRMRWEILKPHRELVLLNEEGAWHYQPDLEQAVLNSAPQNNPLYLLLQGARDDLDAHWSTIKDATKPYHYQLVANNDRQTHGGYKRLTAVLDAKCGLNALRWQDDWGQRTEISLKHAKSRFSAAQFSFKPPAGTAVYRQ